MADDVLRHPSGAHTETSLPDGTLVITDDNGVMTSMTRDGQDARLFAATRQQLLDAGYVTGAPEPASEPQPETLPEPALEVQSNGE